MSVNDMWGHSGKMLRFGFPDQLALRKQIEQGMLFGPTICTAGPTMEGSPSFHPLRNCRPKDIHKLVQPRYLGPGPLCLDDQGAHFHI